MTDSEGLGTRWPRGVGRSACCVVRGLFSRRRRAVRVTGFGYSGNNRNIRNIRNLSVRADGAVAFAGEALTPGEGNYHVFFKAPSSPLLNLSSKVWGDVRPLTGNSTQSVARGSLELVGDTVAWVQSNSTASSAVGCFAQIGANSGHAVLLTGLPTVPDNGQPVSVMLLAFNR